MNPSGREFALMFTVATVGMLLLAVSIVLFVLFYQRKMLQEQIRRQLREAEFQKMMLKAALDSQEKERRRLAADLHDSIGAMLSTIRVGLSTLPRSAGIPEDIVLPTKNLLDDTIESVRSISRDLMPATLEKFGLSQAISEMCMRITSTAKIEMVFNEEGQPVRLSQTNEVMLYRIVQELFNNAVKHASPTQVQVRLNWNRTLEICVEDNGRGFDYEQTKNENGSGRGLGLFNIGNRSRLMGASLSIESKKEEGTKILIQLPIGDEPTD
jgi:signal transduction histidine kinase